MAGIQIMKLEKYDNIEAKEFSYLFAIFHSFLMSDSKVFFV